jgi:hypothetical protein
LNEREGERPRAKPKKPIGFEPQKGLSHDYLDQRSAWLEQSQATGWAKRSLQAVIPKRERTAREDGSAAAPLELSGKRFRRAASARTRLGRKGHRAQGSKDQARRGSSP